MENFDPKKFIYTIAIALLLALAGYFGYTLTKGTDPNPSPTATATATPTPSPTSSSSSSTSSGPTNASLKILDSYERVEYAAEALYKDSASVKLSKGEPVGYAIRLANDTEMPVSTFTKLYKMVPIQVVTPSYTGGKTGTFYDALVPLNAANLAGTKYVYADYTAPATAGSQVITLKQAGQTVTLNATVIENALAPNKIPLYIAVINSFLTTGHYGMYKNGSEALGIPYVKEAVAHRITPYNSHITAPPVVNGLLNYDLNSNIGQSFQQNVLNFVPQGFMMPNYSSQANLQAAEATVKAKGQSAWFYTKDEPGAGEKDAVNALIAIQKQYAPSIKTMVTTSSQSGITPDIYCPVIDHFGVQTWAGGPIMPGESAYAGKELWLYTSCMEHACGGDRADASKFNEKISGNSTGAPGFTLDREAAYVLGFLAVPLRYKTVKGLLYYNSVEQYKLMLKGVDVWTDQWNFGGNGDGTLFYPLRTGMYGSTTEQPAPSIRMKLIRSGEYMMDYAAQGSAHISACGGDSLVTDSLHFEKNADKYKAFRDCLIGKLGF